MTENVEKRNPLIPLMNEGLGELMCRRHFFITVHVQSLSLVQMNFIDFFRSL